MPYDKLSDLPANVQKLSEKKQRQWKEVFNSCMKDGKSEGTCFAMANGVTKKEVDEFALEPADLQAIASIGPEALELAHKSYQYVDSYEYQSRQISQEQAGYSAVGGTNEKACSNCFFFVSPARCTVVSGEIASNGLSNEWRAVPAYESPVLDVRIVKEAEAEAPPTPAVKDGEVLLRAGAFKENKTSVRNKVAEALGSLLGMQSKAKETEGFFVQKQSDGSLRWYTRYSNSWQDRDGEVVTQASHKEYVDWATENKYYPELWVWHAEGSRIGQADWLDFSDGFAHASGTIDQGQEPTVLSLAGKELGVSHGMFSAQVGKYITKHRTFEISVLPRERASVWTTDFGIIGKETELMGFTPARREFLVGVFGEEKVKGMEANTDQFGQQLKALGVEFKEVGDAEPAAAPAETPAITDAATKEVLVSLAQKSADTLNIVNSLVDTVVALRSEVAQKTKAVSEQVDEGISAAWEQNLLRAIKSVGVRPSESGESPAEGTGAPAAAQAEFDLGSLITKQLGLAATAGAAAGSGVGTPAAASVRIA